jgi:hypothetical protein
LAVVCCEWNPVPSGRIATTEGQKSRADLAVVPVAFEGARPAPPAELDELEAAIWTAVVDACPPGTIDPAAQQVLRRLVAQAAVAERLETRMRELRAAGHDHGEDSDALIRIHREAAKAVANLMATLRATPRSRTRPRDVVSNKVPLARPWERKPSA